MNSTVINFTTHKTAEAIEISLHEFLTILPKHLGKFGYDNRPVILFTTHKGNDMDISIQASDRHYSTPKAITKEFKGYSAVEVGYPSWDFSQETIDEHSKCEGAPPSEVYSFMDISLVAKEIFRAMNEL